MNDPSAPAPRAVVWIDGGLCAPDDASVSWSDHGLTVGDGIFETIQLRDGRPFALTRHLDRLARSASAMGLRRPDQALLRDAVDEVAAAWGLDPGRLRITYTAGTGPMGSDRADAAPTVIVAAGPMAVQRDPTTVITVPYVRNERSALCGVKTTSYAENVVALAAARAAGATEALFANTVGQLCEGTGSNVFVEIDGDLVTPPLQSGCLAGVTRALLLDALEAVGTPAVERDLAMSDLSRADAAFLVSTGRHVQPIAAVDGTALKAPGPLTTAAAAIWAAAYADAVDP